MIVDPRHQRSPDVKNIKSGNGYRLGNLIPYEKQVAKCNHCKDHFFMPDMKDGVCKKCRDDGHELNNGKSKCVGQADASQPCEDKPIS